MFMMLANGISKTVAYIHVLSSFSSLPRRAKEFNRAVLTTALAMLGWRCDPDTVRAKRSFR